jgi:protein-tyrosine phosphatase
LKPEPESRHGLAPELVTVLWQVRPEFLDAAYEVLDQDYGGLEGYLREGLGLGEAEQRRLGELYLEPGTGKASSPGAFGQPRG